MGLAKIDTREPFGKIISFKECNYKITGTTMSDGITTEVFVSKVDRSMNHYAERFANRYTTINNGVFITQEGDSFGVVID